MQYKFFRALFVRKGLSLLLLFSAIVVASAATITHLTSSAASADGSIAAAEAESSNPADSVLRLSIKTNEIEFNPHDNLLYATRPSTAGAEGNSVTRIDPLTGNILGSVFVGSEPNDLAFSDTGETMYTVLEGAFSIQRYDVATHTPGLQFPGQRTIRECE